MTAEARRVKPAVDWGAEYRADRLEKVRAMGAGCDLRELENEMGWRACAIRNGSSMSKEFVEEINILRGFHDEAFKREIVLRHIEKQKTETAVAMVCIAFVIAVALVVLREHFR